ncbi:hypothetical protein, partial [Paenibacillus phytohabitans]|uniref:hypothetical protein n=1 Tax=Paenibacillus phytohabitans TaxID=2654978 RepID=UPI0014920066
DPLARLQEPGNGLALVHWSPAARGSAAAAVDVLPEAGVPGSRRLATLPAADLPQLLPVSLDAGEPSTQLPPEQSDR